MIYTVYRNVCCHLTSSFLKLLCVAFPLFIEDALLSRSRLLRMQLNLNSMFSCYFLFNRQMAWRPFYCSVCYSQLVECTQGIGWSGGGVGVTGSVGVIRGDRGWWEWRDGWRLVCEWGDVIEGKVESFREHICCIISFHFRSTLCCQECLVKATDPWPDL